MSGKTQNVLPIMRGMIQAGVPVLAYSSQDDPNYQIKGVIFTRDPDYFEELLGAFEKKRAFVIIDEAASIYGLTKMSTHPRLWTITSSGRHNGHSVRILCQSLTKIPAFVRDNLHAYDVFVIKNKRHAKMIVEDQGIDEKYVDVIRNLGFLEFLQIRGAHEPALKRLQITS